MELLAGLNTEQRRVATDTAHHLLLNAPAGTGKTFALAARMAYLIHHERVEGSKLLCLTFTNRACKELKHRIAEKVPEKGLDVVVKTIHGFCYSIIKEESKQSSNVSHDFLVYDDDDCKALLAELVRHEPIFQENAKRLQKLQQYIEIIKKDCILRHHYAGAAQDYTSVVHAFLANRQAVRKVCDTYNHSVDTDLEQWFTNNGCSIITTYAAALAANHALDFADLILHAYALLSVPAIQKSWQERFSYIAIDEMQDTSEIEYKLFSLLFPGRIILLCGDYFQTIYEWRGSYPKYILQHFTKEYAPQHITFTVNYRATTTLLHASSACLQHLFPEESAAFYTPPSTSGTALCGEKITIKACDTFMSEGRYIFEEIAKLPVEARKSMCILTRSNKKNKQLWNSVRSHNERLPEDKRLPFAMIDQFQLFKRQECKDVIAFLRLLVQPHNAQSLLRIIKRFVSRVGSHTVETITGSSYARLGIRITDFIDPYTQEYGDPFGLLLTALEQGNIVVFDVESTGTDTSHDDIIQIAAIRLDAACHVTDQFVTYVKPHKAVGSSYYVHHISDTFLAEKGIDPKDAITQFIAFAKNAVIVGHNVTYDLSILCSEMARLGMDTAQIYPYYDTLELFRRFYPDLPNHTLGFLSEYFHLASKPSHDALDDITATAELLRYAVTKHIIPNTKKRRSAISMYVQLFAPVSQFFQTLRSTSYTQNPANLIAQIMTDGGVKAYYSTHELPLKNESFDRIENVRKLYLIAKETASENQSPRDTLHDFLLLTALSNSELDTLLAKKPHIPIITIHQAKGLEFEYVFLANLQEGTFPLSRASGNELEEEKRLFYVAITRAKKKLYLTWHRYENQHRCKPSPFLFTLPPEDLDGDQPQKTENQTDHTGA